MMWGYLVIEPCKEDFGRALSDFSNGYSDRRQRRTEVGGEIVVVEAGDGDLARNVQTHPVRLAQRPEGQHIVATHDSRGRRSSGNNRAARLLAIDRKSVVMGKSGSVGGDIGGRRNIKKK